MGLAGRRRGTGVSAKLDTDAAVLLREVRKVYGTGSTLVTALREVNVEFAAGRFTAVMGPSGSGKTTLLHCAAGLTTVNAGQVFVGETELSRLTEQELAEYRRREMGFVFQDFNLLPALSGRENIVLPLRLAGRRPEPEELKELLRRTGVAQIVDRHPHELSGGQQQRVAICRALATTPRVVFADEPTGALDSRTSEKILALLRETVDQLGQTVVMVTHEPAAAAHADRVLFLRDGRIVEELDGPSLASIAVCLAALEKC